MQRDMDYVRELLLQIEQAPTPIDSSLLLQSDLANAQQKLSYHIGMLVQQAGLLSGTDVSDDDEAAWIDLELTWHGHEYLDAVRDPEVWRRTKEGAKKAGNSGIAFMFDLAKAFAKQKIKEHLPGLEF